MPYHIDFNPVDGRCDNEYPFELGIVDARELAFGDDVKRVAAYVAGYVLKKFGKEKCLPGKEPEFQVMSKGPGRRRKIKVVGCVFKIIPAVKGIGGLGVPFVENFVKNLKGHGIGPRGYDGVAVEHDLQMIRIHGKLYPLHRTLREKVQKAFDGPPTELAKALRNHGKAFWHQIYEETEAYELEYSETEHKAKKAFKKYLRSRLS